MTKRIRYKRVNKEGTVLQSIQTFFHPYNGAQYVTRINTTESKWYILDANTEMVAAEGSGPTLEELQFGAKKALVNKGISLHPEKRKRNKKTTEVTN